jgi:hypothetical protein
MVEAPLAILGEIIFPLITSAIELGAIVLFASARPWAYLLIPSVRHSINEKFAASSSLAKIVYLLWGTCAVAASILVIACVILFFRVQPSQQHPSSRTTAEEIARKALGTLKQSGHSSSAP